MTLSRSGLALLAIFAASCTADDESASVTTQVDTTVRACESTHAVTDSEIEDMRALLDVADFNGEGNLPVSRFFGLCEAAAFELAAEVGIHAFVSKRDGEWISDLVDTFTNSLALVVVDGEVVGARHL